MGRQNQKFGVGDYAKFTSSGGYIYIVKIIDCILDESGKWFYEVEATDLSPAYRAITREISQDKLEEIE